mmetsp:Transcript_44354/g.79557  ORF Transcript_44354/g.79557 Transcript_44354/m.79557 type:complete len:80 (-) Transcript_44354:761-1000(-)
MRRRSALDPLLTQFECALDPLQTRSGPSPESQGIVLPVTIWAIPGEVVNTAGRNKPPYAHLRAGPEWVQSGSKAGLECI